MNQKALLVCIVAGILVIIGAAIAVTLGMPEEETEDVPGDPLNPADFAAAEAVDGSKPAQSDGEKDQMWNAGLFEGDMANFDPSVGKNAIRGEHYRWPKNTVPYEISRVFSNKERSIIARGMKEYKEKTCLRFIPRTSERDYIYITKETGCWSYVGRNGGKQKISLDRGCVYVETVIHEFMHAVGFHHEQSRSDRDEYVTIIKENIKPGMEHNFQSYSQEEITHLGAKYDYCSVMHYPEQAFRKRRGLKTIVKKKASHCEIGQATGFSDTDIRKINTLYKCSGYPQVGGDSGTTGTTTPTTTTTTPPPKPSGCQDNSKWCGYWAKNGECDNHPNYMRVNCPKSCRQCDKDLTCVDNESHCQEWADDGWCQQLGWYMDKYCPKACKKCSA